MADRGDRSNAEFLEALAALTESQHFRLRGWADNRALDLPMTGDDLIQEAVTRTLERSRTFPQGVGVLTFLKNAMKSIASAEREKVKRIEPLGDSGDEFSHINRIAARTLSPEDVAALRIELTDTLQLLCDRLADDEDAVKLLEYRLGGWTNAEIMEVESMDPKRFDAARKRLRRAIERIRDDRGGS